MPINNLRSFFHEKIKWDQKFAALYARAFALKHSAFFKMARWIWRTHGADKIWGVLRSRSGITGGRDSILHGAFTKLKSARGGVGRNLNAPSILWEFSLPPTLACATAGSAGRALIGPARFHRCRDVCRREKHPMQKYMPGKTNGKTSCILKEGPELVCRNTVSICIKLGQCLALSFNP